jgi:hypothetical protein
LVNSIYFSASKRFFQNKINCDCKAVAAAEHGHIGEIQVVIEGHMPAREAYYLDTRGRAKQLLLSLVCGIPS